MMVSVSHTNAKGTNDELRRRNPDAHVLIDRQEADLIVKALTGKKLDERERARLDTSVARLKRPT